MAKLAFEAGFLPSDLAELRIIFSFLLLLLLVFVFRRGDLGVRRRDLSSLAAFGIAGIAVLTVIPFGLTLAAVSLIPAARVGLTATFEPVVAAVAAFFLLHESLEPPQLAGGAVVLAGIAIAQSLRPREGGV